MEHIIKHNSIETIPNIPYEGYIWLSDAKEPIMLFNETFNFKNVINNPFIIEALLYNAENKISVHIQHTDDYQIFEYHLGEFDKEDFVDKEYLPHRLKGVQKVMFKQIWLPEKDMNCAEMEVLNLKAIVFCGFKK